MTSVEAKLEKWRDAITASIARAGQFGAVSILESGGSPWLMFEAIIKHECGKRGISYSLERYENAVAELRRSPDISVAVDAVVREEVPF